MINLFSIYKKALLIPRSGLDELPDTTLFGLLIYWNDLQLSSLAFPEWKRNQLLLDLERDRECFADFRISSKMESQSAKNGVRRETLSWVGTAASLRANGRRWRCSHQSIQGHCARPSWHSLHCPGVLMATGSPPVNRLDMQVSDGHQWRPWPSAGTALTHLLLNWKKLALNGF